ncbi:SMI1/KNR4 family protein [Mucilaginibacter sp. X5P1]|uniref:SMI1/KNR4 family protein n=1 Tax=Mucilaginibacter sp. X5P1 TaxID=2723088 RepID=UPI0016177D5A|nr:SMI1/KNR4 family protein [Mucilaginibacter sp. X5P1]MBB6140490.1 hypothetical protein [Mucilaginibacter sp. X5P1]
MKTIQDIIEIIKENKTQLGITLYEPAYYSEIEDFERELNIKLPDDIKEFYRFCNGFETNQYIFRIIPLKEIIQYADELSKGEFYIAEYLIYSDHWKVMIMSDDNRYKIIEGSSANIITDSFAEFLDRFLKSGLDGLCNWNEQIDKQNQQ